MSDGNDGGSEYLIEVEFGGVSAGLNRTKLRLLVTYFAVMLASGIPTIAFAWTTGASATVLLWLTLAFLAIPLITAELKYWLRAEAAEDASGRA